MISPPEYHQLKWRGDGDVRLPPGRFRLATRPICTGSAMVVKTIGMVAVAAFAAIAEGVVKAVITDTWR